MACDCVVVMTVVVASSEAFALWLARISRMNTPEYYFSSPHWKPLHTPLPGTSSAFISVVIQPETVVTGYRLH